MPNYSKKIKIVYGWGAAHGTLAEIGITRTAKDKKDFTFQMRLDSILK
jgi:hypothetical protein